MCNIACELVVVVDQQLSQRFNSFVFMLFEVWAVNSKDQTVHGHVGSNGVPENLEKIGNEMLVSRIGVVAKQKELDNG